MFSQTLSGGVYAGIQHVINFDMPEEIENYVHRIGRTGRRGRTGLATTFVSLKDNSEIILLDLKHLLKESKQPIPPVLQVCFRTVIFFSFFLLINTFGLEYLHTITKYGTGTYGCKNYIF